MGYSDLIVLKEIMNVTYSYNRRLQLLCDKYDDCVGCPLEMADCTDVESVSTCLSRIITPYASYESKVDEGVIRLMDAYSDVLGAYYVVPKNTPFGGDTHTLYVILNDIEEVEGSITETLNVQGFLMDYFDSLNMSIEVEVCEDCEKEYVIDRLGDYKYDNLKMYGGVEYECK